MGRSKTSGGKVTFLLSIDAAAQGASTAIMLVLNIAASLIAFLAFVEFLNHVIGKISA